MEFRKYRYSWANLVSATSFFVSAFVFLLLATYTTYKNAPSGTLTFNVTSTQQGSLEVLYTKDGHLIRSGSEITLVQRASEQYISIPLGAGTYELIGFKPLLKNDGTILITNVKITSAARTRYLGGDANFVAINKVNVAPSSGGWAMTPAAQGADAFGGYVGIKELIQQSSLKTFFGYLVLSLFLLFLTLGLLYYLFGVLPFAFRRPLSVTSQTNQVHWIGLFLVGLAILYLRNAASIFMPVLYTEDGVWSAALINDGLIHTLLNARQDYLVLGNIFLLALAGLANRILFGFNLTYLPHFISLFSMAFYAALAITPVFFLKNYMRLEVRALLWLLILLMPLGDSSYEILGRASNIGFAFVLITLCLLLWRHQPAIKSSKLKIVLVDFALFVSANTNPICYVLIGLVFAFEVLLSWKNSAHESVVKWLKSSLERFWVKSAILLLVGLFFVGTWMLLRDKPLNTFLREGTVNYQNIVEVGGGRGVLYSLLFPWYSNLTNSTTVVLLGILILSVGFLALRASKTVRLLVIFSSIVILINIGSTIGMRPDLTTIINGYSANSLDRYFYATNILVCVVICAALSSAFTIHSNKWERATANLVCGSLLGAYVGSAIFLFELSHPRFRPLPTTSFEEEIAASHKRGGELTPTGRRYAVSLHPQPWITHFPEAYILETAKIGLSQVNTSVLSSPPPDFLLPEGLSDNNWENGIWIRQDGQNGFFIISNENMGGIKLGSRLKFAKSGERTVTAIHANGQYVNIFVNGNLVPQDGFPQRVIVK